MDIKKTVTIEGTRSWTGPMENYEAHKECVEHWCGGGEVEFLRCDKEWEELSGDNPAFFLDFQYRIKRREPQNGEVWIIRDRPCIYSSFADDDYNFLQIDGGNAHNFESDPVYAAPSVEAYIAKKLIQEIGDEALIAYEFLCEKAGEE